jgi:hypothetical protein
MPAQDVPRAYPLIDSDPHAGRVIRYMRGSDYGLWAGATAAGPGLLYLYGEVYAFLRHVSVPAGDSTTCKGCGQFRHGTGARGDAECRGGKEERVYASPELLPTSCPDGCWVGANRTTLGH